MRYSTPLAIAATLLLAAPAAAQDNAATATNDLAAADAAINAADANAAIATDTTNGVAADPMAPVTADPMATDPAYGEPAEDRDDDRFPWGLLGLLGLAGLIPRKERPRRHDGAI